MEPKEVPQTDGHVRIAGEVEVDLERVGDGAQPRRGRRGVGHGGDLLPDGAHLVGDEHLLAQADHQPLQALAGLRQILPPVLQIVGHRLVLHDGPGDQLGEQRHIRAEVDDVPLGRHQSPVHVDGVAHGLEGVEGDADGQQQPQRRYRRAQQPVDVVDGEIRVLEEPQNGQISHHRQDQHALGALFPLPPAEPADGQTVAVVEHGGEQHDQDILWLTPAVKQQAEHQKQAVAQLPRADIIQNSHQRQERQQEGGAAEYHSGSPLQLISKRKGRASPPLRLSKKSVIASQCAPRSKCPWGTHWRGNPFPIRYFTPASLPIW